jgi:hypothetical protein
MTITVNTRNYIGKGQVKIGKRSGGLVRAIGNAKALNLKIEVERKALLDYTASGGGEAEALERVKSLAGEIEVTEYSAENLAIALRGLVTAVAAGVVTGESHVGYKGGYLVFNHLPDPSVAPVVKKGATTLVANTDYTVRKDGMYILPATSAITDGDTLTVDYTKAAAQRIDALVGSGDEYYLWFEGLNEGSNDNPVLIKLLRVTFSPTSGLDLIGDDWGGLKLSFSALKDPAVTGAGLSAFMEMRLAA